VRAECGLIILIILRCVLLADEFYEADESPSDANAGDALADGGEAANGASDTAARCGDRVSETVTDSAVSTPLSDSATVSDSAVSAPLSDSATVSDSTGSVQQCESTAISLHAANDTEDAATEVGDQNVHDADRLPSAEDSNSMSQLDDSEPHSSDTQSHLGTDAEAYDMRCESKDDVVVGDECPSQPSDSVPAAAAAAAAADTHSQPLDTAESNDLPADGGITQSEAKDNNLSRQLADESRSDANADGAGDLPDSPDCSMQSADDSNAQSDDNFSHTREAKEEAFGGNFLQPSHDQPADDADHLQDVANSNDVPAGDSNAQSQDKASNNSLQPTDGQLEAQEAFDSSFSQPTDNQPAGGAEQVADNCTSVAAALVEDEPSTADSYDDPAEFVEASASLNPEPYADDTQPVTDGEEVDLQQLDDDDDNKDDDEQFVDSASDIFPPQPVEGIVDV